MAGDKAGRLITSILPQPSHVATSSKSEASRRRATNDSRPPPGPLIKLVDTTVISTVPYSTEVALSVFLLVTYKLTTSPTSSMRSCAIHGLCYHMPAIHCQQFDTTVPDWIFTCSFISYLPIRARSGLFVRIESFLYIDPRAWLYASMR